LPWDDRSAGRRSPLKLVDSKVSTTGVTINTYERAGDIDYGSFAFDEPTEAEIEWRRRLAAASSP
jgi:hypothetical protein